MDPMQDYGVRMQEAIDAAAMATGQQPPPIAENGAYPLEPGCVLGALEIKGPDAMRAALPFTFQLSALLSFRNHSRISLLALAAFEKA